MPILGELNFSQCGNEVKINGLDAEFMYVDIKIGDGPWLILTSEQVEALKNALVKEA